MASHPLYGKKKKKKEDCPNPLFAQWLMEWRDAAADKGIKSQYTYGKALKTLRKFPLKFETGKECKILENFGDKICKMLDDKLAEHVSTHGTTAPVVGADTMTDTHVNKQSECKVTSSTWAKSSVGMIDTAVTAPTLHDMSDCSEDDAQLHEPARKRQKSGRRSGDREYIPVYRSGPYALLVTLYTDVQSAESRGYLSKADLMRNAQPLADKSFTMTDPGCRYTAWSSMGSLITRGFVIKERNPARYSITDAGCQLAHKLEAVKEDASNSDDTGVSFRINHPSPVTSTVNRLPIMPQWTDFEPGPSTVCRLPSMQEGVEDEDGLSDDDLPIIKRRNGPGSNKLKYWYVSEEESEVLVKDKAVVIIDDEIGVGFLVKCNYTNLLQSNVKYKLDTTRPLGDDYVYVYLCNKDTDDVANPPYSGTTESNIVPITGPNYTGVSQARNGSIQNTGKGKQENKAKRAPTASKARKNTPQLLPLIQASLQNKQNTDEYSSIPSGNSDIVLIDSGDSSRDSLPSVHEPKTSLNYNHKQGCESICDSKESNTISDFTAGQCLFDRLSAKQDSTKTVDSRENSSQNSIVTSSYSQSSIKSLSSVNSESSVQNLPTPGFVLRPGEFDIVLCIDNAEFYGATKGSSKTLLPDLIRNGIECDLRKLHVGDLLWVAKEKTLAVQGQLAKAASRELVLNYIIERKRMDDLVGSCIDGRFKEQKFRLKKCGLHHTMYLVEDYGSMQHFSLAESTIKQAITNTQVIDGFQVKRTMDSKETVAFLTVFTRYLQSNFKDKTLYACSLNDIKESKIITDINDSEQRLAVFEEFNHGSVKTKALTVQEMFGKQLIQLHGMSAEKARAIIDKYPTPSHLLEAYEMCASEKEKESLLASVKCGKSFRSLGQGQSKQMSQLYNTCTALT